MDAMEKKTAHVDYLTMTWRGGGEYAVNDDTVRLINWYKYECTGKPEGWQIKPLAWQGYIGTQIGTMSWGERADGSVIRISGGAAQEYLEARLPIGDNCSRLDISLTLWGITDIDGLIALHKEDALERRKSLQHRPWGLRHITTNGDGDTLYIGSRTSTTFVRVYNKEKEQANDRRYETAIRYEVEYKDERATEALHRGRIEHFDRRTFAAMALATLESRGVYCGSSFDARRLILNRLGSHITDSEAKINWLRTQVRPTVRFLLDTVGLDAILEALGISS